MTTPPPALPVLKDLATDPGLEANVVQFLLDNESQSQCESREKGSQHVIADVALFQERPRSR